MNLEMIKERPLHYIYISVYGGLQSAESMLNQSCDLLVLTHVLNLITSWHCSAEANYKKS